MVYTFLQKWGGSQGSGDGQFYRPRGIAVDSSTHEVYVADTWNNRIQKFDSSGKFIQKWGKQGSGDGQFYQPHSIAVDSSTHEVYVADTQNSRIQKFDFKGNFILKWGSQGAVYDGLFSSPMGIAVDSATHEVYVADTSNTRIQKFHSNGTFILKWGEPGFIVWDLAVDSSTHNVYACRPFSFWVESFTPTGVSIYHVGGNSYTDGGFNRPQSVAVDSSTHEFFVSDDQKRIQKFHSNGTFILKWGNPNTSNSAADGFFYGNTAIAVDSSNHRVYVIDGASEANFFRIQVFIAK